MWCGLVNRSTLDTQASGKKKSAKRRGWKKPAPLQDPHNPTDVEQRGPAEGKSRRELSNALNLRGGTLFQSPENKKKGWRSVRNPGLRLGKRLKTDTREGEIETKKKKFGAGG